MFSESDRSLNRTDSRFTGHSQTGDVINIYFIILYIIKILKINKFYVNFDTIYFVYFVCWVLSQNFLPVKFINLSYMISITQYNLCKAQYI